MKENQPQEKVYPTTPDDQGFYFASAEDELAGNKKRRYPTSVDADGFFIESDEDDELGIQTKVYDNANRVKRATLPVCGKIAVVRELLAKDTKDIARFTDGDAEKYQIASVVASTTLDSMKQPIDVIENLKLKDYTRILAMHTALNF
ncbi:hypothetical protein [Chitinophaga sp. sic0106]|uniref:hypothetical protein n=1 Tax=Chitinophaga sp. sic0106 TaxID=2854785 RepID=UPI001C4700A0|nr:hypothetical protein [Chitinophaga sp. sic0106]MBV7529036.1 hypothetical protein [Chitinophaga sp. sic0106]